jgi:TAP-like protein.
VRSGAAPPRNRIRSCSLKPPGISAASRYDPSTPYKGARNLARQTGARLLTYAGSGHAMHQLGSECVDKAIERCLTTLRTPARGARCPAIEPRS